MPLDNVEYIWGWDSQYFECNKKADTLKCVFCRFFVGINLKETIKIVLWTRL